MNTSFILFSALYPEYARYLPTPSISQQANDITEKRRIPDVGDMDTIGKAAVRFSKIPDKDLNPFGKAFFAISKNTALPLQLRRAAALGHMAVMTLIRSATGESPTYLQSMSETDLFTWFENIIAAQNVNDQNVSEMKEVIFEIIRRDSDSLRKLLLHQRLDIRFMILVKIFLLNYSSEEVSKRWGEQRTFIEQALKSERKTRNILPLLYLFAKYGVQEARGHIETVRAKGLFLDLLRELDKNDMFW